VAGNRFRAGNCLFAESETMKQRLLAAMKRQDGFSVDAVVEKLEAR